MFSGIVTGDIKSLIEVKKKKKDFFLWKLLTLQQFVKVWSNASKTASLTVHVDFLFFPMYMHRDSSNSGIIFFQDVRYF